MRIALRVNGGSYELDVAPDRRLVDVLRDDLGLLGTKLACGEGACGACAVLLDGRAVASCILLAAAAEGREIRTIEGLSRDGPTPLQAGVRRRGRAPVRLLHARADRHRDGAARAFAASDAGTRSETRWRATSAAAARIPRSSARSSAPRERA